MTRMGHSSTRAARVYLHAREERDRQLASDGPARAEKVQRCPERRPIGTQHFLRMVGVAD
jgi:hypothetical protein